MTTQEVLENKINKHFNAEVNDLVEEVHEIIRKARNKYRGYSTSNGDEVITKEKLERIFERYASVKQYGSPQTCYLSQLIKAIIIIDVEENGKKQLTDKLLNQIENFFKD
tara:strand:+ start:280 stop:609 length:330 start_codon:yes stop_codon:yes gene_type:complete